MQLSKLQEICHDLKQSKNFQIFVSIVIIYSSLIIGVNSYSINGYLESFIFYSDHLITIIFLIELLMEQSNSMILLNKNIIVKRMLK